MIQLRTISHNHMALEFRCGHRKLVSVQEMIRRLNPNAAIYEVARKAKYSHCVTKGAAHFRLLYVCGRNEEI